MPDPAPIALADPRTWPDAAAAAPEAAAMYAQADASLGAATTLIAAEIDRDIQAALAAHLDRDGAALAELFAGAPSVSIARHLWRLLDQLCALPPDRGEGVAMTVFALPVVIVAGADAPAPEGRLSGVLADPARLAAILEEHHALAGNRTFALANVLVGADAIDLARLAAIRGWERLPESPGGSASAGTLAAAPALAPAPIAYGSGREAVSLRFLLGSALAKAGTDIVADATVGKWGIPFARALGDGIGAGGVSVLALPRAPQRPLRALRQGRAAQREVSAQVFASNALRRMRGEVGEATAVISAHRAPDARGGGELRLSLSSPFAPRDAEGFRCPLYALDRVGDVAAMLVDLLRDCRVADVRMLGDVFPDRDPATGVRLLFKPETIPPRATVLH